MSLFTFSGNKLALAVLAAGALAVGGTGVAAMAESLPDAPSVLAETESPEPSPPATETESPEPSPTATETESPEPTPTETETEAPDPTPTETESPEPAPTDAPATPERDRKQQQQVLEQRQEAPAVSDAGHQAGSEAKHSGRGHR
ncbi:hypothetical protein ACFFGR_06400 [Arthrobacter liuii]|uniref:Uncharacterized protein n=1 Tax=Arthrobacter liuii TaxID=1476996 RepID=A0ABQ2AVC5_9MICC|nr:hypothetical protein [Arthrobacter liuii]GGH96407.1 hypothetical protein GCM10007170_24180 [Arthrobacter liuii]